MKTELIKRMNDAAGAILDARQNLKIAQGNARPVLMEIIAEKKAVKFMPSKYWAEKIAAGFIEAENEALIEESPSIEYDADEGHFTAFVKSIHVDDKEEGLILIDVVDQKTGNESTVLEADTWDIDNLLEFCYKFANAN